MRLARAYQSPVGSIRHRKPTMSRGRARRWSPLARGRLARESASATGRSGTDPFADMLYPQELSDRAIIDAVAAIAKARGVSRAQVSLAWLRRNPVVVAQLVGATKPSHLDDAVASLEIELTDDEVAELEAPLHAALRLPGRLRRRRTGPHLGPTRHQAGRLLTRPPARTVGTSPAARRGMGQWPMPGEGIARQLVHRP